MRHKISNFLKQYAFMLALAAMFVGFSAFKFLEQHEAPQPGTYWYEIGPVLGQPGIVAEISPNDAQQKCEETDPLNNELCAIRLNETGLPQMTLEDVEEDHTILESRFKEPEN